MGRAGCVVGVVVEVVVEVAVYVVEVGVLRRKWKGVVGQLAGRRSEKRSFQSELFLLVCNERTAWRTLP